MQVRRVVTGHNELGKAVVVWDGIAPNRHTFTAIPGMDTTMVWASTPEPITTSSIDPTTTVTRHVAGPGESRFVVVTFPPDSVFTSSDFDPAAAQAEHMSVSPDLVELFEPENPGMHVTPTVDYIIVLKGEVTLELDDEVLVPLKVGDTVVQNGTRHGWRNPGTEPTTLCVVMIG